MKTNLSIITSTIVPLSIENIDTDQIIPARFLKAITREGFGENLFRDWRYNADGSPKPDFVLNNPLYSGEILVTGKNFGCGSSREHAAWALADYGFKAVLAPSFSDIFRNNALNNGLLAITLSQDFIDNIFQVVQFRPQLEITIDLAKQEVLVETMDVYEKFEINAYKKICLMNGYDDVEYLLSLKDKTNQFENSRENDYSVTF